MIATNAPPDCFGHLPQAFIERSSFSRVRKQFEEGREFSWCRYFGDAIAVHVEGHEGARGEDRDPSSPLLRKESYVSGVRERAGMVRR